MKTDVAKIRKLLEEFDKKYDKDPKMAEEAEEYRKKYATLADEDLHKPFTI